MKYIKIEVITTTQVEELLAYNLNEQGIDGVEIINNTGLTDEDKKSMFIDILPHYYDDGKSILRFFIENKSEIEKYYDIVNQEIEKLRPYFNVGDAIITSAEVDDSQWKDRWKEFFKPFYIDDIYISPTWINDEVKTDKIIKIDPGCAFGTGLHETTRLCIRQLRKLVKPDVKVLDIGCGSAILSIVANKFGASEVTAIDIDENAINVSKENFEINGISKTSYNLFVGNIIEDVDLNNNIGYGKYDIIVANLLSEIIVLMAEKFLPHIKNDGCLITSGILKEKEKMVIDALKNVGFNHFTCDYDGDWVGILARR